MLPTWTTIVIYHINRANGKVDQFVDTEDVTANSLQAARDTIVRSIKFKHDGENVVIDSLRVVGIS